MPIDGVEKLKPSANYNRDADLPDGIKRKEFHFFKFHVQKFIDKLNRYFNVVNHTYE